ncbi:hypothetical protein SAMN05444354_108169 [Stigmatella aurantiaca]|uniref:Uncharacterized protein n=1 Tax=Stigmatella aurantiaca TaxID=41 RepID=A0A1H7SY35_STIAU|nr:putative metal-binding motif-containing protein [Stigmatella aurantiaca]SEL76884.1 hypothetical protein SAMN05444354_108169 [Stigmatella aurantiaca]
MYRACVLGLFLSLVACKEKAPGEGAIRVSVKYGTYVPACLRVSARDAQGHEARTDIPREKFQNPEAREVRVAVFRKPEWDRELSLEVSSYRAASGQECAGDLVEKRTSAAPIPVPRGEFAIFDAVLEAQDQDGDSFIALPGLAQADCDDVRKDVYPGAPEQCSVNVDFDCDGLKGCQDAKCVDKACDDGNACTTGDQCNGALCQGQAVQCQKPTGVCFTGAVCNPTTGQCDNVLAPPETVCNDQDPCTVNDTCGPQGQCSGQSKSCNAPPTACFEASGTCDAVSGECRYPSKPAATECSDEDACTVNDQCNGNGMCGGLATPCQPSSTCFRITSGCVALGNCTEAVDPAKVNTACQKGNGQSGVCRVSDGACSSFPYVPSNFDPDTIPDANIGTLTTSGAVTFDSTPGAMNPWEPPGRVTASPPITVIAQANGAPDAVVLAVRSVNLGGDLKLVGTRPVILAVYGDATLNHHILANSVLGASSGPGSNQACGARQGVDGTLSGEGGGGGGGGGATAGASGGKGYSSGATGGGAGSQSPSVRVPLVGGCPGGKGGGTGGLGGTGGGAIQISVSGTLTVGKKVTASGGAGVGGNASTSAAGGGGGGGSGGQVTLEALRLVLSNSAQLTANGGGGGEGGGTYQGGKDGDDGYTSSGDPAMGGQGKALLGGNGGTGGASAGPLPVEGSVGTNDAIGGGGGGGGGGAVGFIHLRAVRPCEIHTSSVRSPEPVLQCPL